MKSREVIRLLQKIDPSGETEVCVGNRDIWHIYREDAYWDGRLQVLKRNETEKVFFNIAGAKITGKGEKILIRTLSIEELLFDSPDAPVEFEDASDHDKADVEEWRKEGRESEDGWLVKQGKEDET